jgi:6-phosphogluconolactonase (cycloisomerase 2 family)
VRGSPFPTGLRPRSFSIHPSGKFAYVANYGVNPYVSRQAACEGAYGHATGKGCTISGFSIDQQTGALSEILGSPFLSQGTNPIASTVDSEGKYLFVANISSNNITVFRVNASNGFIEPVPGSPFAAPYAPCALALDWSDDYLYVLSPYSRAVAQFSIDGTNGKLRPLGRSIVAGKGPASIAAERDFPN